MFAEKALSDTLTIKDSIFASYTINVPIMVRVDCRWLLPYSLDATHVYFPANWQSASLTFRKLTFLSAKSPSWMT